LIFFSGSFICQDINLSISKKKKKSIVELLLVEEFWLIGVDLLCIFFFCCSLSNLIIPKWHTDTL